MEICKLPRRSHNKRKKAPEKCVYDSSGYGNYYSYLVFHMFCCILDRDKEYDDCQEYFNLYILTSEIDQKIEENDIWGLENQIKEILKANINDKDIDLIKLRKFYSLFYNEFKDDVNEHLRFIVNDIVLKLIEYIDNKNEMYKKYILYFRYFFLKYLCSEILKKNIVDIIFKFKF